MNGMCADSLRLAADELERAHRAGEEIVVSWWWLRDRADALEESTEAWSEDGTEELPSRVPSATEGA